MSPPRTIPLAIVIPAYKTRFLREALQSVAGQTDRGFQLYVGDDHSPEPVAEIVREFQGKLDIQFHRFEQNLGRTSLVRHMERCIRLTREPWVWVFSDDDRMDENCVAAFAAELKDTGGRHDAYRFNTLWMDGAQTIISQSPPHPLEESGGEFLRARLRGDRNSTLQEVIFSRQAWEASGGIPDFHMGWAADDAFIARLGTRRPIRTIAGPRVSWRLSDANISNNQSAAAVRGKIRASADFVRWTTDFFDGHPPVEKAEAARLTERWFLNYVSTTGRFLDLNTCRDIERLAAGIWGRRAGSGFLQALKLNSSLAALKISRRLRARKRPC